ncbi:hypothetical protein ACGFW5_03720 [Streptomyces sp. NPDC048416]|uniref:hypothetical protein n=1 Tax=Streptomyces sp. NPDC048416 TaxID=3365546 RepID=UPI003719AB4F
MIIQVGDALTDAQTLRVGEVIAVEGTKVTLASGPFHWEQEKHQCRPASIAEQASLGPANAVRVITGEYGRLPT